jgi:hypothetical protein
MWQEPRDPYDVDLHAMLSEEVRVRCRTKAQARMSDYTRTRTMRSLTDDELVTLKKNLEELKGMPIKARAEFIGVTEETILQRLGRRKGAACKEVAAS